MKLRQFQIDAFTSHLFKGNPAAVCPLEAWLPDDLMQAIAAENNLSETAFFVPVEGGYDLRWFTPVREVDLCGHATLASAHVLFEHLGYEGDRIHFCSRGGDLTVSRSALGLTLDFPARKVRPAVVSEAVEQALGKRPRALFSGQDYLAVFSREADICDLRPDFAALARLDVRGVIVTAPGDHVDFVSRFFAPAVGIDEDPVTGSAHCALAPYWSLELGKHTLSARQVSARGGELHCEVAGERVLISGQAVTFSEGVIHLPD